ncbi:uncharacterized protein LOC126902540 [Daktulosphaira vitifoliae]|uniref:uncharacterized protein LOC126902540 n=1 Tax=Daktulosphaira vitifoliae TaxID=58002 RepID=UPI0021A988B9|nr:uncharacterized protein LOC126902540 [Daktulosphaira vitifoliae]
MDTIKLQSMAKSIEFERLAHAHLCEIVEDLSTAFGPCLIIYFFFLFYDHLIRFFLYMYLIPYINVDELSKNPGHYFYELLIFFLYNWTGLYLIALLSDKLTLTSKKMLVYLRCVPVWKMPKNCVDQINFFTCQIQNSNTKITASKLFTVKNSIISSIFMALVTYIIALIQLSQDIKKSLIKIKYFDN